MPSANTTATFCATIVDEWIHIGVRDAVIAPGSRSTPLALALSNRPELRIHIFHDERVAGFAAMGIGLLGVPAIVLCSSGTAATHLHAAVVEAHQARIPMIVCTADRPPELRDVGAPQTIDQTKLYGGAVRWFHEPGIATQAAAHTWRSLAAHAWAMACGHLPGPVHLNLAFREPLLGEVGDLPVRRRQQLALSSTHRAEAFVPIAGLASARGLIVAGRGSARAEVISLLSRHTGWPVLADARSGVRHLADAAVTAADALLRDGAFAAAHQPQVILRLGEPPASKVVSSWLLASLAPQVHLSAQSVWIDPDAAITQSVVGDVDELCLGLIAQLPAATDQAWLGLWLRAQANAQRAITEVLGVALTEPLIARAVTASLPVPSHLMVSSSMPIRDVEWYGIVPEGVAVHSNRGANGIDGVISTAIGIAAASGEPTTILIGDVAFLHDSSALIGLSRRSVDLRIVVVDNDGGGIFSFLPQGNLLDGAQFEQLFGTPHGTDLGLIAAAHGVRHTVVETVDELLDATARAGPSVTIVKTERRRNVAVHDEIHLAVAAATGG